MITPGGTDHATDEYLIFNIYNIYINTCAREKNWKFGKIMKIMDCFSSIVKNDKFYNTYILWNLKHKKK